MLGIQTMYFISLSLSLSLSLLGHLLSQYESPNELEQNDSILRQRYMLDGFPIDKTYQTLTNLPNLCLDFYNNIHNNRNNNETKTIEFQIDQFPGWEVLLETSTLMTNNSGISALRSQLLSEQVNTMTNSTLKTVIENCGTVSELMIDNLKTYHTELARGATTKLSFNWIRCWNTTEYGKRISSECVVFIWEIEII
jgi:hypothetical protein